MTYLLSEKGRRSLRTLAQKPLLYAFDFDGTLAPISPNRDAVQIIPSITEWIKELAKRVPCAIVSGRALADLAPRINGMVPYLIGNHGIESSLTPLHTLLWAEGICTAWKRDITTRFADTLKNLGGEVEDKQYSLTVHYRAHAQEAEVRPAILSLLQQLTPAPDLIVGKSSVNALPPGQGGKGPAILALMRHLRQIGLFFVGDDETDEYVFGLTEVLAMGIRVGIHAESQAKFYLKHQGEMEEVLRFLVHRIDRTPEAAHHGSRQTNDTRETANDS
jgi:trehalose 6-phosphate phosphatase